MCKQFQVLLTLDTLSLAGGGPVQNVVRLKERLDVYGVDAKIIYSSSEQLHGDNVILPKNGHHDVFFSGSRRDNLFQPLRLPHYESTLERLLLSSPSNLIHDNGIWTPRHCSSTRLARKMDVPLVLSPRGMLQPWALEFKKIKKSIAWNLYQRNNLNGVSVFHAASESEVESIRSLGFKQPIAMIPNGIPLHASDKYKIKKLPKINGKKTALYLSRIHPSKGLVELIHAWSNVRPNGWGLVVAGPDEAGHKKEVIRVIREKGLSNDIEFLGPVSGIEKESAFLSADLFILPSFSENFGLVVAEALSYSVPVITTTGAPWPDLEKYNCGWWVAPNVDCIAKALKQATAQSANMLSIMGENGFNYVQRFSSDITGDKFLELFLWILGKGSKPSFIADS